MVFLSGSLESTEKNNMASDDKSVYSLPLSPQKRQKYKDENKSHFIS
jgi:hypothetical protein